MSKRKKRSYSQLFQESYLELQLQQRASHLPRSKTDQSQISPFGPFPNHPQSKFSDHNSNSAKCRFSSKRNRKKSSFFENFETSSEKNLNLPETLKFSSKSFFGKTFASRQGLLANFADQPWWNRPNRSFGYSFKAKKLQTQTFRYQNKLENQNSEDFLVWNLKRVKSPNRNLFEFRENNQKSSLEFTKKFSKKKTLKNPKTIRNPEKSSKLAQNLTPSHSFTKKFDRNPPQLKNKEKPPKNSQAKNSQNNTDEDNLTVETRCFGKEIERELDFEMSRTVRRVKKDPEKIPLPSHPNSTQQEASSWVDLFCSQLSRNFEQEARFASQNSFFRAKFPWQTEVSILEGNKILVKKVEISYQRNNYAGVWVLDQKNSKIDFSMLEIPVEKRLKSVENLEIKRILRNEGKTEISISNDSQNFNKNKFFEEKEVVGTPCSNFLYLMNIY